MKDGYVVKVDLRHYFGSEREYRNFCLRMAQKELKNGGPRKTMTIDGVEFVVEREKLIQARDEVARQMREMGLEAHKRPLIRATARRGAVCQRRHEKETTAPGMTPARPLIW